MFLIGGYIFRSTDYGNSWTQTTAPFTQSWTSISSDSSGQHLVAVASYRAVYHSKDYGSTWIAQKLALNWMATAISSSGQYMYAATGGGLAGQIYMSSNIGTTWLALANAPLMNYNSLSCDSTGQMVFATVLFGPVYINKLTKITFTMRSNFDHNVEGTATNEYLSNVVIAGNNCCINC